MKNKKRIKFILGFGMSLVAISPILTLTSCGSFSQYYLPFITNGQDIFADLQADPDFDTKNHFDHDGQDIFQNNYLPKSYIYDGHTGQGVEYLYSQPENVNTDPWTKYNEQWYTTSSNEMATAAEGSTKVSYRNYNQLAFTNTVLSISNNLAHFYSNLLTFQGRYVTSKNNDEIMTDLFGGLDHGDKTASGADIDKKIQNKDFYEFMYSLSNTLSVGSSPVKFDVSSVDFQIKTWENGPGPFITKDSEEKFTKTLSTEIANTDMHVMYGDEKTYKDNDGNETKYHEIKSVQPIPFLISKSNLNFSFYNPLEEKSFSPNGWLIDNVDVVNNEIKRTNAWKNFNSLTDEKPEVDATSWNISSVNNDEKFGAGAFPVGAEFDNVFTSFAPEMCYSDFVVLANYSIKTVPSKDEPDPTKLERVPVMSGISGIYPAYMFKDEKAFTEEKERYPGGDKHKYINKTYLDEKLLEINKKFLDVKYVPKADDLPIFKYLFSATPEGDAKASTLDFIKKII